MFGFYKYNCRNWFLYVYTSHTYIPCIARSELGHPIYHRKFNWTLVRTLNHNQQPMVIIKIQLYNYNVHIPNSRAPWASCSTIICTVCGLIVSAVLLVMYHYSSKEYLYIGRGCENQWLTMSGLEKKPATIRSSSSEQQKPAGRSRDYVYSQMMSRMFGKLL